eukprot:CAMPEP_0175000196 /NCGR_PEP_ID=MMETSP0005-20121125/2461_1 /TAXON_ID=420556 /ORGANISM="Ochromonas sp., Strain CCMP1393" /LENGTH=52 /DNA_ID=CAMNT_0016254979 /DNA_START=269 /DNA_END=427 /DNA_ORIENTATION=+
MPTLCCKGKSHCCCMVGQCAFPPGGDVPALIAMLCITCYPKFGVCMKMSEVA